MFSSRVLTHIKPRHKEEEVQFKLKHGLGDILLPRERNPISEHMDGQTEERVQDVLLLLSPAHILLSSSPMPPVRCRRSPPRRRRRRRRREEFKISSNFVLCSIQLANACLRASPCTWGLFREPQFALISLPLGLFPLFQFIL